MVADAGLEECSARNDGRRDDHDVEGAVRRDGRSDRRPAFAVIGAVALVGVRERALIGEAFDRGPAERGP